MLVVFCPFAAGYYLSYFYRYVNAVIAKDLVADFGIAPSDLGLLTSAYFLAFAARPAAARRRARSLRSAALHGGALLRRGARAR